MKRPLAVTLLVVMTVVVIVFDVTVALGVVASARGAERVEVTDTTLIGALAAGADRIEAVRVPVSPDRFPAVDSLTRLVLPLRMEVSGRGPREIVYRGGLPGLQVLWSYALNDVEGRRYLTLTSAFYYQGQLARLYGGAIRMGQWGAFPYMASRWAE